MSVRDGREASGPEPQPANAREDTSDRTDHRRAAEATRTDELPDGSRPTCQIARCDRPGVVPRKMRAPNSDEPVVRHFICRYHHRLFIGIKAGIVLLFVLIALYAFFEI